MECPHCKKEVFGKGHDVSDLYDEELDIGEQILKDCPYTACEGKRLQAENNRLVAKFLQLGIGIKKVISMLPHGTNLEVPDGCECEGADGNCPRCIIEAEFYKH